MANSKEEKKPIYQYIQMYAVYVLAALLITASTALWNKIGKIEEIGRVLEFAERNKDAIEELDRKTDLRMTQHWAKYGDLDERIDAVVERTQGCEKSIEAVKYNILGCKEDIRSLQNKHMN